MRIKYVAAATLTTASLLSLTFTVPAFAATKTDYNVQYCDGGRLANGYSKNTLSNGTMFFGWCETSTGAATTMTVKYEKRHGSAVKVVLGYQWTNGNGGAVAGTHYDSTGVVTIRAGETWGARFRRSPAEKPPSRLSTCMRGIMKVDGTTVYSSGVICG